ncbi:MAG: hypothetical protein ACOY0T_12760 [Myxococcota bacterium]
MNVDIASIEDPEVAAFAERAVSFLLQHSWCREVVSGRKVWAIPGVLGVFLLTIVPVRPGIDTELWVIVGDLPPAYIARPVESSWQDVLCAYIDEMRRWVVAVRNGESLKDIVPVNVEPTLEYADRLDSRLGFIQQEFLSGPADAYDDVD